MKVIVQYFCNLLIKKKQPTSYPLSTLVRLLAQIVYVIDYISKQLTDLFNLSFLTGVFPSVLKAAKVVPVFKKDSKLDYIVNYHPISLLSNIEKILEKLMYKRLYVFFNNNDIIYNLQLGFRQHYSTSHALINITETIKKALDDGNIGWSFKQTCKKLLILQTTRYCQQN